MQTVAFRVPDHDLPAFMKLVETMPTVQRVETPVMEQEEADEDRPPTKQEILEGIRQGILEIREAQKTGKPAGRDAREVLEELRRELA